MRYDEFLKKYASMGIEVVMDLNGLAAMYHVRNDMLSELKLYDLLPSEGGHMIILIIKGELFELKRPESGKNFELHRPQMPQMLREDNAEAFLSWLQSDVVILPEKKHLSQYVRNQIKAFPFELEDAMQEIKFRLTPTYGGPSNEVLSFYE